MNSPFFRFINKYILPCYFLLFVAILAVRDFTGIAISQYLMLAYILVLIIFASYKSLVNYTAILLPMLCGIFLFLIAFLCLGLILKAPKKPNRYQIGFTAALFVIEAMDQFQFINELVVPEYDFTRLILYGSFLLTTFYFVFLPEGLVDRKQFVRCYCYGTFITLAIILASSIIQWGFAHLLLGYRIGDVGLYSDLKVDDQAMFTLNSNSLAYYAIYSLATLLVGRSKLGFNIFIYWILLIGFLLVGILSFSRTYIVLAAFFIFLTFITSANFKMMIVTGVLVFGIATYALVEFEDITKAYEMRFSDSDAKSGGDRTNLISSYNEFFLTNPQYWLFGTGVVYYKELCRQQNSIHNATQQIYINTGIVGTFIFAFLIFMFFKKRMVKGVRFSYYLPAMAVFLFLQTLQVLNPMELMCPITLACMTLCIGAEEKKRTLSIRKKYENRLINVS